MIEVLSALSAAASMANGYDADTTLRMYMIADALARESGVSAETRAAAGYAALLRYIGCTAYAHEEAQMVGDAEIPLRKKFGLIDPRSPTEALLGTLELALNQGGVQAIPFLARLLLGGRSLRDGFVSASCEVAARLAQRLGMPPAVGEALAQIHERWDGRGGPAGLAGDRIHPATRIVQVAGCVVIFDQTGGPAAPGPMLRRGRGRIFDPDFVDLFLKHEASLLELLRVGPGVPRIAEPSPARMDRDLDRIAEAFGDFADLQSAYTTGHSRNIATLCARAGPAFGLSADETAVLRRAAWLHDLGAVTLSTGLRERPGALSPGDIEQIRLHAYRTERILARDPRLARESQVAGRHHERCDGTGYHRGERYAATQPAARLLAVAEAYQSMIEPRAHRLAFSESAAADLLREESRRGFWDARAVECLLDAAGHRTDRDARTGPAGLSEREVQVLRLLARGASNKEIGRELAISHRTAQHHVQHIYDKIGVATRAAAALFAAENSIV